MDKYFIKVGLDWLTSRLSEASTWAGLTLAVGNGLHIDFNSDFKTAVIHAGLALGGVVAVVIKEGIRK